MKILLIEDEKELADGILNYLRQEGYVCEYASDFLSGDEKVALYTYDCVLLDLTLPGGNGLDILRNMKINQSRSGVIILSAKNSIDDKIVGLDIGADDYISKPFHLAELNSRIKSVLRRKQFDGQQSINFNEIMIQADEQNVQINGKSIVLTKKEFDLLLFFVSNKNRVLTKEGIAEHLWGDDMDMSDSFDFIYTHIKNLRKKIIEAGGQDYVKTIYGLGYKFGEA